MRLRLTYLIMAVLVLVAAATVWVQIERSRQNRHGVEMQRIVDSVAARLNLPAELLYADGDTRERFNYLRKCLSWKLRAQDPSRYPSMAGDKDMNLEEEPRYFTPPAPRGGGRGGIFGSGPSTTMPASLPADEVQALAEDAPQARINDATEACKEMVGWFMTAGDPVGEYLKKHPEVFTTELEPLLLRLTKAQDGGLKMFALTVFYVRGDRAKRDEIVRIYDSYAYELEPETEEFLIKAAQLNRHVDFEPPDPYANLPEYDIPAVSPVKCEGAILPAGGNMLFGEKRLRHDGEIAAIAFSPDSKKLATAGGNTVCLWDSQSGALLAHTAVKGSQPVAGVAFASDSTAIVLAGNLWTWDFGAKPTLRMVGPKDGDFMHIAVSPDGKLLAATERRQRAVQVLAVPSFQFLHRIRILLESNVDQGQASWGRSHPPVFGATVFSSDSKAIIGAEFAGNIQVFDALTGKPLCAIPRPPDLRSVAPAGEGNILLDAKGRNAEVWDLAGIAKTRTLKKSIEVLGAGTSGRTILAEVSEGDKDGKESDREPILCLLDARTLEPIRKIESKTGGPGTYILEQVSPDSALAAGIAGNCVNLWDLTKDQWRVGPRLPLTLLDAQPWGTLYAATDHPNASSWDDEYEELRCFGLEGKQWTSTWLPKDEKVRYPAVSGWGPNLATCSKLPAPPQESQDATQEAARQPSEYEIRIRNEYGKCTARIKPPGGQAGRLVLSGDLLTWLSGDKVCVWDLRTDPPNMVLMTSNHFDHRPRMPEPGLRPEDFDPQLISGPHDPDIPLKTRIGFGDKKTFLCKGTLSVWDELGEHNCNPLIPADNVVSLGDDWLATEGCGRVTIWRLPGCVPVRQFDGPEGMDDTGGEPMMWLGDDYILTASGKPCLVIWDFKTCKPVARLRIPSTVISFLASPVSPQDGKIVYGVFYTSHPDSTVIQWDREAIVQWCKKITHHAATQPATAGGSDSPHR